MTMTIEMAIDPLGLGGLNHLALRRNGLVARHAKPEWQLGRWVDASKKQHHFILDTQSDANAARDGESRKATP
jgi:hypothetical protein